MKSPAADSTLGAWSAFACLATSVRWPKTPETEPPHNSSNACASLITQSVCVSGVLFSQGLASVNSEMLCQLRDSSQSKNERRQRHRAKLILDECMTRAEHSSWVRVRVSVYGTSEGGRQEALGVCQQSRKLQSLPRRVALLHHSPSY